MDRLDLICAHPKWLENLEKLKAFEENRKFCRHTLEHFLDVARIAYIEELEKGLGISKELIYAAALLHDIGRAAQYQGGTPHEQAGAALAREIMGDCGFSEEETAAVLGAIQGHRDPLTRTRDDLAGLLYRADKTSRICLFCPAEPQCNWDRQKKNLKITV